MKKIAIIPLRKGSKGIIGKNKKKILGRPLFTWVLGEAILSNLNEIYVFTNDDEIISFIEKEYYWTSKVKALKRDEENAIDTASTENAMLEFSKKINNNFDILCLLQATSPLTNYKDINAALKEIESGNKTSSISVVKTHRFVWNNDGTPYNYDIFNRPRRQDFDGLLIENGAIYATTQSAFLQFKNRISGTIGLIEMSEESLIEIDSQSDWDIVEKLLSNKLRKQKKQQRIDYLVLDVDGVFTDGCVYYTSEGEFAKKFDMRDGMGLEILRQNQVEVVVLTSENSELVAARMKKLQINHVFLGVKDKYSFLQHFIEKQKSNFGAIAYIGDDVNDLANICSVGYSFAPNNATNIVKFNADIVLTKASSEGAIREVCDIIMNYNKRYEI